MSHIHCPYQIVVELYGPLPQQADNRLTAISVAIDWLPAVHCATFELFRRRPGSVWDVSSGAWRIVPRWHDTWRAPHVAAFEVISNDQTDFGVEISTTYCRAYADHARQVLIHDGRLAEHEQVAVRVCAYPATPAVSESRPANSSSLSVETVATPVAVTPRSLADYVERSHHYGVRHEGDVPVFVPRHVLDEAVARTQAADTTETGGVLIGHLRCDPDCHAVFLEVSEQIPARRAEQALTQLTFTPETWSDVAAAIRLRSQTEIYLGWWHSHPARAWCSQCPPENRQQCKRSREFFSRDDAAVHRCVFGQAYQMALVISDAYASGITYPMFGWRNGLIQPRGFSILTTEGNTPENETDSTISATPNGRTKHEKTSIG